VVAREDAEAAGVDGEALVDAELGAEVRDERVPLAGVRLGEPARLGELGRESGARGLEPSGSRRSNSDRATALQLNQRLPASSSRARRRSERVSV
jgi:hypothetical protein